MRVVPANASMNIRLFNGNHGLFTDRFQIKQLAPVCSIHQKQSLIVRKAGIFRCRNAKQWCPFLAEVRCASVEMRGSDALLRGEENLARGIVDGAKGGRSAGYFAAGSLRRSSSPFPHPTRYRPASSFFPAFRTSARQGERLYGEEKSGWTEARVRASDCRACFAHLRGVAAAVGGHQHQGLGAVDGAEERV